MTITYIEGFEDIYSPKDLNDIVTNKSFPENIEFTYGTNIGANNGTSMVSGSTVVPSEHGYLVTKGAHVGKGASVSFKGRINTKTIISPSYVNAIKPLGENGEYLGFGYIWHTGNDNVSKLTSSLVISKNKNINEMFDYIPLPTDGLFDVNASDGSVVGINNMRAFYNTKKECYCILVSYGSVFEYINGSWVKTDIGKTYNNVLTNSVSNLSDTINSEYFISGDSILITDHVNNTVYVISLTDYSLTRIYYHSKAFESAGTINMTSVLFKGIAKLRSNGSVESITHEGVETPYTDDSEHIDDLHKGLLLINKTSFCSFDEMDDGRVFIYSKRGWNARVEPTAANALSSVGLFCIYDKNKPLYQRYKALDIDGSELASACGVTAADREIGALSISPNGKRVLVFARRSNSYSASGTIVLIENIDIDDVDSFMDTTNHHNISEHRSGYSDVNTNYIHGVLCYECRFSNDSDTLYFSLGTSSSTSYISYSTTGVVYRQDDGELGKNLNTDGISGRGLVIGDFDKIYVLRSPNNYYVYSKNDWSTVKKIEVSSVSLSGRGGDLMMNSLMFQDSNGKIHSIGGNFTHTSPVSFKQYYHTIDIDTDEILDIPLEGSPSRYSFYGNIEYKGNDTYIVSNENANSHYTEIKLKDGIITEHNNITITNNNNRVLLSTKFINNDKIVINNTPISNDILSFDATTVGNKNSSGYFSFGDRMYIKLSSVYVSDTTSKTNYDFYNKINENVYSNYTYGTYGCGINTKTDNYYCSLQLVDDANTTTNKIIKVYSNSNAFLYDIHIDDIKGFNLNITHITNITSIGDVLLIKMNTATLLAIKLNNDGFKKIGFVDHGVINIKNFPANDNANFNLFKTGKYLIRSVLNTTPNNNNGTIGAAHSTYVYTEDLNRWLTLAQSDTNIGSYSNRLNYGYFGLEMNRVFMGGLGRRTNNHSHSDYINYGFKTYRGFSPMIEASAVSNTVDAKIVFNQWNNYRIDVIPVIDKDETSDILFHVNDVLVHEHKGVSTGIVGNSYIVSHCSNSGLSIADNSSYTSDQLMIFNKTKQEMLFLRDDSINFDFVRRYPHYNINNIAGSTDGRYVLISSGAGKGGGSGGASRDEVYRYDFVEKKWDVIKQPSATMADYRGLSLVASGDTCYAVLSSPTKPTIIYKTNDWFDTWDEYTTVSTTGQYSSKNKVIIQPNDITNDGFILIFEYNAGSSGTVKGFKNGKEYPIIGIPSDSSLSEFYYTDNIVVFLDSEHFICYVNDKLVKFKINDDDITIVTEYTTSTDGHRYHSFFKYDENNITFVDYHQQIYTFNHSDNKLKKFQQLAGYSVYRPIAAYDPTKNEIYGGNLTMGYKVDPNKEGNVLDTVQYKIKLNNYFKFFCYSHNFINEIDDIVINDLDGSENNKILGECSVTSSVFENIDTGFLSNNNNSVVDSLRAFPASSNKDKFLFTNPDDSLLLKDAKARKTASKYLGSSFTILNSKHSPLSAENIISISNKANEIKYSANIKIDLPNTVVSSPTIVTDSGNIKMTDITVKVTTL